MPWSLLADLVMLSHFAFAAFVAWLTLEAQRGAG